MEYDRKTEGMKEIMDYNSRCSERGGSIGCHGQQGAEQERSGIAGSP